MLDQGATDLIDVSAHQCGGSLGVSLPACLKDRVVFRLCLRHEPQAGDISIQVMLGAVPENLEQIAEVPPPGSGIQCGVETMVQIHNREDIYI